jgi:DNA-directed RNA polymerase subunit F
MKRFLAAACITLEALVISTGARADKLCLKLDAMPAAITFSKLSYWRGDLKEAKRWMSPYTGDLEGTIYEQLEKTVDYLERLQVCPDKERWQETAEMLLSYIQAVYWKETDNHIEGRFKGDIDKPGMAGIYLIFQDAMKRNSHDHLKALHAVYSHFSQIGDPAAGWILPLINTLQNTSVQPSK